MTAGAVDGSGAELELPRELRLPLLLLSQYLFFLTRRPISESNPHYLVSRLEGLQSLGPVLASAQHPVLERVVAQLADLHPGAFRRIGPALQLSLIPVVASAWPLPSNVVVEDGGPAPDWLSDARRVLLAFGPGIGIGDELIFAPLPRRLRATNPAIEVDTLSAYRGFWDRVDGVRRDVHCSSHLDLLHALRGEAPFDGYDVVIFADFEAPGLYRGIAAAAAVPKYLEISLGARTAYLFDQKRQWLHRLGECDPYFLNYYHAFDHLLRRLHVAEESDRFAGVVRRNADKASGRLDVFASPFTSKYDPSVVYWSRLLTIALQHAGPAPLTLHIDTGKNWKTQRFALELSRAIVPMLPANVDVRLAREEGSSSLSLPAVYDQLERCHAVICADSFAAHAAPLFGCMALVLAKSDLKDWHVPAGESFYFDASLPVAEVGEAMGTLLAETLQPKSRLEVAAAFSQAELELVACSERADETNLALCARVAELFEVVAARRRRSAEPLFRDSFSFEFRAPEGTDASMALHLRDRLQRWRNTNFAKAVRRALRSATETRPAEAQAVTRGSGADGASVVGGVLVGGIRSILREQRASGEIATYFRFDGGGLEYRRSPLLSTFVHDALGTFDLTSRWVDTAFLDTLPPDAQGRFVRAASQVRQRIRRFLLWDEGNDGGWRLFGRAGSCADLDTTACSAAVLAQAPRRKPAPRWPYHAAMLAENGSGALAARVNVLRFLALVGEATRDLVEAVLDALRSGNGGAHGNYGHPLVLPYCIARTWAQAALPRRDEAAELVVPRILAYWTDGPADGDVLGNALGLNALLDFEYSGPETIAAAQALLRAALPTGGWAYAPLLGEGGGSPACTSALAMTALARSGVAR